MMRDQRDFIELRAVHPAGDIACDTTIATPEARAGLGAALRAGMRGAPAKIDGGVAVTFAGDAWDAVQRCIDLESRCCSFLSLSARRSGDAVILEVTGRAEAQGWIANIFSSDEAPLS
jgi:hypothetical protein